MDKIYREQQKIEYYQCDESQRIKLTSLIDLMMVTSEHQLAAWGAGADDLVKQGKGWVVTQYHFDITHLPTVGQTVTFQTEAAGYNRFFSYRNFSVTDAAGQELVKVTSRWVLFDLAKRKLLPSDETLMEQIGVAKLPKMPRFPRLRPLDQYSVTGDYQVRYDDLDSNHHLTNSHYFSWLLDVYSRTFLQQHQPKTIDLAFDKEVQYGQTATVGLELAGLTAKQAIYSEAATNAVCEINWQNAD